MKEATHNNNWANILPIYQICMDHEQSIRTSYQSLLTTLEVALFALLITLYQLELRDYFWLLAIAGIFLCFCFGVACEYHARLVDTWRTRIVKLISGTEVEDAFKEGKYRWIPLKKVGLRGESLFGHWFERILIPMMLLAWLYVLWSSPIGLSLSISLVIRSFSTLVTCSWILYVFRFRFLDHWIESRAEYYDYHRRKRKSKWVG
jgi:hypothetical protein